MLKELKCIGLGLLFTAAIACGVANEYEVVECTKDSHCSAGEKCLDQSCESTTNPNPPPSNNGNSGTGPNCSAEASCDACVQCSNASVCASKRLDCELREDCVALQNCIQGCSASEPACISNCKSSYSEALPYYSEWLDCVFCDSCMAHCGTQDNCS